MEELNRKTKMTENERMDAIDLIEKQIGYGYVDVGGSAYENELEIVRQAMNILIKLPEIIDKLKENVYRIDDSATLSSRDVINSEDVFELLNSLLYLNIE